MSQVQVGPRAAYTSAPFMSQGPNIGPIPSVPQVGGGSWFRGYLSPGPPVQPVRRRAHVGPASIWYDALGDTHGILPSEFGPTGMTGVNPVGPSASQGVNTSGPDLSLCSDISDADALEDDQSSLRGDSYDSESSEEDEPLHRESTHLDQI